MSYKETFQLASIYKITATIEKRIGENLAVAAYDKKFRVYHVPSGQSVMHKLPDFDTIEAATCYAFELKAAFPEFSAVDPNGENPGFMTRERYDRFKERYDTHVASARRTVR